MEHKLFFLDENQNSCKMIVVKSQIWPTQEIDAKMFKGSHKWLIVARSHE
jgi:hypothetical protein